MYAKENNSPRSNGGHATASNAENDKSLGEVPAPQAALNAACEHRNKGNTLFKQKMYTEAEAAYSAALKALLVHKQSYPADVKARQVAVFYSNRAAAKLMLVSFLFSRSLITFSSVLSSCLSQVHVRSWYGQQA